MTATDYLIAQFKAQFDNAQLVQAKLDEVNEVWNVTVFDGCLASSADCTVIRYIMEIGSDDDSFLFHICGSLDGFPDTVEIPLMPEVGSDD